MTDVAPVAKLMDIGLDESTYIYAEPSETYLYANYTNYTP